MGVLVWGRDPTWLSGLGRVDVRVRHGPCLGVGVGQGSCGGVGFRQGPCMGVGVG